MPNDEVILLSFVFNLAGSRPLNLLVSPIPDNTTKLLSTPRHAISTMSETYTIADVQKHKTEADGMWLIVENNVYDITSM